MKAVKLTLADGRTVMMAYEIRGSQEPYTTLDIVSRAIAAGTAIGISAGRVINSRYIIEAEVVETGDSAWHR